MRSTLFCLCPDAWKRDLIFMDADAWNAIIAQLPNPHILQTWQWGEVKSNYGWQPFHRVWRNGDRVVGAALVLQREASLGGLARLRMQYAPKGPLLADWGDQDLRQRVLSDLREFARQQNAFTLKIDPDVRMGRGVPETEESEEYAIGKEVKAELEADGWRFSDEQVQYRNTVLIDLTPSEDDMLMRMKQKTRYNVRLAGRRGVSVRRGTPADFDMLYDIYAKTAVRDGFVIRHRDYYKDVWESFYQGGMLTPLIAMVEGEAVGGLMLFTFGRWAWYLYGMSREAHREKMPNYLLQWEAMRAAKAAGCTAYDLWGAPDVFDESDPLWGVYRFKDGFGGTVARHIGAWDLPLRPWLYSAYTQILPRALGLMRMLGRRQTRRQVGEP